MKGQHVPMVQKTPLPKGEQQQKTQGVKELTRTNQK
jgi:hypothetical protein